MQLAARNANLDQEGKLLRVACIGGDLLCVRRLLHPEHAKQLVYAQDEFGALPIHHACAAWNHELVHLLLQAGGREQLLHQDFHGKTPAWTAALAGDTVLVNTLLQLEKESFVATNMKTFEILRYAALTDRVELAKVVLSLDENRIFMQKDASENMAIHYASMSGAHQVGRLLLQQEPRLRLVKDKSGRLPIHLACDHDHGVDVLHLLLEQDVQEQIHMQDKKGAMPLHLAIRHALTEAIQLLIEYGGVEQLRVIDHRGLSVLEHAGGSPWDRRHEIYKHLLIPRIEKGDFTEIQAVSIVHNYFREYCPSPESIDVIWTFINHGMSPSLFPEGYQARLRERESLYRRKSARK